jgi:hypothetical protein
MSQYKQACVRYGAVRITLDEDLVVNHLHIAAPRPEEVKGIDMTQLTELGISIDAALSLSSVPEVSLEDAVALQEKQWQRDHLESLSNSTQKHEDHY